MYEIMITLRLSIQTAPQLPTTRLQQPLAAVATVLLSGYEPRVWYVRPVQREPEVYHRWSGLSFSIMDGQRRGEVMPETEKASVALASRTETDAVAFPKATRDFQRKNGKLFTRLQNALEFVLRFVI